MGERPTEETDKLMDFRWDWYGGGRTGDCTFTVIDAALAMNTAPERGCSGYIHKQRLFPCMNLQLGYGGSGNVDSHASTFRIFESRSCVFQGVRKDILQKGANKRKPTSSASHLKHEGYALAIDLCLVLA